MEASLLFKALSDATRRAILKSLRAGPKAAGEIAESFELSKATLSHHLALLLEAGLVRCERRAQSRIYALNTSVAEDVAALLMDLFGHEAGKRRKP